MAVAGGSTCCVSTADVVAVPLAGKGTLTFHVSSTAILGSCPFWLTGAIRASSYRRSVSALASRFLATSACISSAVAIMSLSRSSAASNAAPAASSASRRSRSNLFCAALASRLNISPCNCITSPSRAIRRGACTLIGTDRFRVVRSARDDVSVTGFGGWARVSKRAICLAPCGRGGSR